MKNSKHEGPILIHAITQKGKGFYNPHLDVLNNAKRKELLTYLNIAEGKFNDKYSCFNIFCKLKRSCLEWKILVGSKREANL